MVNGASPRHAGRSRRPLVIAVAATLPIVIAAWLLWPAAPRVGNDAYRHLIAIDSACSRRDTTTIERLRGMLDQAAAERTIDDSDRARLAAVLDQAQAGEWEAARRACRRLLEGRVTTP